MLGAEGFVAMGDRAGRTDVLGAEGFVALGGRVRRATALGAEISGHFETMRDARMRSAPRALGPVATM